MSILLKQASLDGRDADILIEGNRISRIAGCIDGQFDDVVDCNGKAVLPTFYNTHCHTPMTLLRSVADDIELFDWLNNHIWPAEARLNEEDIYWGSKLACMEMIKSGTVLFNDSYFMPQFTIQAAEDTGMRAAIGLLSLEANPVTQARLDKDAELVLGKRSEYSSRIQLWESPHAIYTNSREMLVRNRERAQKYGMGIHIHLSETRKEVEDCIEQHGCSPVRYLEELGLLGDRTIGAHAVHLSDEDVEILRKYNVAVAHNPCSNYKLGSGQFRFKKLLDSGVRVTIGTDGNASNNSLSMFDEMKVAALFGKLQCGDITGVTDKQVFKAATQTAAEFFGLDAGVIAEGKLADLMLIDLDAATLAPNHNLISNIVYSCDTSCVSSVICDGRFIMRDGVIPGYRETLENARRCARHLVD